MCRPRVEGGDHARAASRAAAVVGHRPGGRALRRRPVRPDQRAARRLRRVAGHDRPGRGLAPRIVAPLVPAGAGRRVRRRRDPRTARLPARVRPAVGGPAARRPPPGAAAGRRRARLRLPLGRRLHVGPRHVRLRGRLPGQLRGDGHLLLGRRPDHPGAARPHRGRAVSRAARWSALGVGGVFGFLLTVSGLGDYSTIHDGLLLKNPYIFGMMASAMAVAWAGLAVLRRLGRTRFAGPLSLPHARIERRHVYGGAIFGLGFGVGATCPGMTVAMTTTGGLYGLVVLVGLLGGLWLRGFVERRQQRPVSTEPETSAATRAAAGV